MRALGLVLNLGDICASNATYTDYSLRRLLANPSCLDGSSQSAQIGSSRQIGEVVLPLSRQPVFADESNLIPRQCLLTLVPDPLRWSVGVALGGDDVDDDHGIGTVKPFGRLETAAVDLQRRNGLFGREVRGEGIGPAELGREHCSEIARSEYPQRHFPFRSRHCLDTLVWTGLLGRPGRE
jgi:hypothetical protein